MKKPISFILILCMVFAMMPMMSITASAAPAYVYVCGTQVSDISATYWLNDGSGGITTTGADANNYNVKYDPSGTMPTLTLSGAAITKVGDFGSFHYAIRSYGDLTIVRVGDSTITASEMIYGNEVLRGVYIEGNALIKGNGSLTVLTENKASSTTESLYGVYSTGPLAISENGILGVTGKGGRYCRGIYSENSITISGGTVNIAAEAGNPTTDSMGLLSNSISISGGTVTARTINTVGTAKAMSTAPNLGSYANHYITASTSPDGSNPVAEYDVGNISAYRYLKIAPQTVPGAPTNLAATPCDGLLPLTWTAPANTGGSPITDYEIYCDGGFDWTPTGSTAASLTISTLENGNSYTLRVRARNIIGAGAASDAITATQGTFTTETIGNQTMTGLTAGYGSGKQETKTVTIKKTGTNDLTNLATTLGGSNPSSFTITQPLPTTLNSVTTQAAFTVKAKDGLAAGTYTAMVIISADSMTSQTFTVTQVVNAASGGSGGGGGGGSAAPLVTKIESGDSVAGANVDNLVKEGKSLTVEGKAGEKLVFDTEALKNIDAQTKESVQVEIKDVSADHKSEHPGRLVVSLTVTAGGKHITSFGNGTATVSLPYELKAGEKAEDVTVWYLAEDGTMTKVPCTYDPVTKLATFKVNHFSLYIVGTADTSKWTNPFSDVKESSWYYGAVRYVSANGMMQGTKDTAFNPNGKTTRGMIVTILWRMENQPKATKDITFADVKDGKYYHDAVAWASEKGIVGGYSAEKFGPEDNITREQLAVILHKYAVSKGYKTDAAADLSVFGDSGRIHSWSKDSLSWANAKGLINGTGSSLINPLSAAERCQVAAILQRFVENTAK